MANSLAARLLATEPRFPRPLGLMIFAARYFACKLEPVFRRTATWVPDGNMWPRFGREARYPYLSTANWLLGQSLGNRKWTRLVVRRCKLVLGHSLIFMETFEKSASSIGRSVRTTFISLLKQSMLW